MGCAQSSPSSQEKQRRNSREFYHGYNQTNHVHHHHQQNPRQRHQHAFVNTMPIKPVVQQHVAKPPMTSSARAVPVTSTRSTAPSPARTSPTKVQCPTVPTTADVKDVDLVMNGSATKRANSPEDIQFRRQHFDRNSVLRHSKKRSRKASNASIKDKQDNTPVTRSAAAAGSIGNLTTGKTPPTTTTSTRSKSPEKKSGSERSGRNTSAATTTTTPVTTSGRPTKTTTSSTNLRSQVVNQPLMQESSFYATTPDGSSVFSKNDWITKKPSQQLQAKLSASENVAALLSRNNSSSISQGLFIEHGLDNNFSLTNDVSTEMIATVCDVTGDNMENNSNMLNGNSSHNSSSNAPYDVDEDGARLI